MVLQADAVIDPGTVVVEPLYAVLADTAVSASTCSDRAAVGAELRGVDQAQLLHELDPFTRADVARILAGRTEKEDHAEE